MDTQISDKMVRFGRVLNVVGLVFAVICLVAAAFSLLFAIIVALMPEEALFNLMGRLELTSGFFVFQTGTVLADLVPLTALIGIKVAIVFAFLGGFFYAVASAVILFIISSIFRSTVARKSPFLPENVKRLKIVGIILIIAAVFLGWETLIFAFCMLALAFIFQYGTELQQQADETL